MNMIIDYYRSYDNLVGCVIVESSTALPRVKRMIVFKVNNFFFPNRHVYIVIPFEFYYDQAGDHVYLSTKDSLSLGALT